MSMSRKDYKVIAKVLNENKPSDNMPNVAITGWNTIVHRLAGEFKTDNSRFDTAKFIKACQTGEGV